MSNQLIEWCCIDRLSRQALPEYGFQVDLFILGINHMVHFASLTTAQPSGTNTRRATYFRERVVELNPAKVR